MTNIPTRSLSDTASTHLSDHNNGFGAVNDITGYSIFIEPTGVAATDTANLQAAFDQGPGVNIRIGPGEMALNARCRYTTRTHVTGSGIGDNSDGNGTCFRWRGGTLGQYRGMIESKNYQLNTASKDIDVRFMNIQFHGGGTSTGNGFINWGARTHIEHCSFYSWDGLTAGNGRGLWLASESLGNQTGSTGVTLSGAENCYLRDLRFECLREGLYVEGGGEQYTDGYITDCEWMTTTQAGELRGVKVPQCQFLQGGGWIVRSLHSNGSPGDFISVGSAMHMIIADCYVDGWGCAAGIANGDQFAAIHINSMSNGDGGRELIIRNNTMRHRTQQSGVTANWPAIWVQPSNDTGFDANVVIQGNNDHVRSGADLSRQYFLQLDGTGGASKVQYAVSGNCPTADRTGGFSGTSRGFDDGHIFKAPNTSNNVDVIQEGNSWQLDDAAPTAGFWPRNTKRWNSGATNGSVMGWYNVANGTPGTWRTMGNLS